MTSSQNPVRHHLLSKMYLRRFADERKQLQQYWFDGKATHPTSIDDASVQRYFYKTIQVMDPMIWEKAMAGYEGAANIAIGVCIEEGSESMSAEQLEDLALWISIQHYRSADFRARLAASQQAYFNDLVEKGILQILDKELEAYRQKASGTTEQVSPTREFQPTDFDLSVFLSNRHLEVFEERVNALSQKLQAGSWHFSKSADLRLITGDGAVSFLAEDDLSNLTDEALDAEVLAMPLARDLGVLVYLDGLNRHREWNDNALLMSKIFNGSTAANSKQYLLIHPEDLAPPIGFSPAEVALSYWQGDLDVRIE